MSREDDTQSSEDLVAAAREEMTGRAGSSSDMVEAARRQYSDLESLETQTKAVADSEVFRVDGESTDRIAEVPVADSPGYRPEPSPSASQRRIPSPAAEPIPAPPVESDRAAPSRIRRLVPIAVVAFLILNMLNSNNDEARDFVEEQPGGSNLATEEVDSAGEVGGAAVDSVEFAVLPLPFGANPNGIEVGFDAVWYLDNHPNNKVGKLDLATGEVLEEYASPTAGLHGAIAIGFDAVWFAPERANDQAAEVIFKLDPSDGSITSFPLPMDSGPSRMTTGLGYVWYTALSRNTTGRLDPVTGDVEEYEIPTPGSLAVGITTGFEAVWFTEISQAARKVGRLDPATGTITEYPMLTQTGVQCCGVTTGFDAVWYTGSTGNVIGRIDPATGETIEYHLPNPGSSPIEIVSGPNAIWFTEMSGSRIGRIDPATGTITEYAIPFGGSGPFGIALDSSIWFSASGGGTIGRLDP